MGQFVPDAVTTERVRVYQKDGVWVHETKKATQVKGGVGLKAGVLDKVDIAGLPMFINLAEHRGKMSLVEVEMNGATGLLIVSKEGFELLAPFGGQVTGGGTVYFGGFKAKFIEIQDPATGSGVHIVAAGVENHLERLFTGIPTVVATGEKIADITVQPNGAWQDHGFSNVVVELCLLPTGSSKGKCSSLDDIASVQGDVFFVY